MRHIFDYRIRMVLCVVRAAVLDQQYEGRAWSPKGACQVVGGGGGGWGGSVEVGGVG